VLDLNGFKLIANGVNSTTAVGIKVTNNNACCNNVAVQNGSIINMGYCGLSAVNTYQLSLIKMSVEELSYPTFDILPSGIFIDRANTFLIDGCRVKNVNVTAVLVAGILVIDSAHGTVADCTVDSVTNNDGVASGYVYNGCSIIRTTGCLASNFRTYYQGDPLSEIGHTCIGFMPTDSTNLTYTDCRAQGMTGCCDDCHGMSLFTVNTVEVTRFYAENILDGDCPQRTGAKATGLEVYGNNIWVRDSHVKNIHAIVPQDLQSTGFSACGTYITFENCTATNVKVLNSVGIPDTSHGNGTGFGWAPDPRSQFVTPAVSASYNSCTANDCQVGFDTWNHQNSSWHDWKVNDCGLPPILVQPNGAQRVYSMNFCSELPNSNPLSPAKTFPIINCAMDNRY
jgi:hypothetical protein